jgi:2-methylcitrate dehydratase PrpD
LQAVYAAASGFTSDLGLFDGRFFSGIYQIEPDISVLTQDLTGRVTLREVSFKPWSAARQSITATQAFKEILAAVDVAQIEEIEVKVPPLFLRMLDHGVEDADRMSRLTSIPYQLAIAALAPDMAFDVGQAGAVPPEVRVFMDKVKIVSDESLIRDFPVKWRAEVRACAGGTWHQRAVEDVPGDPSRPFDEAAIREKCRKLSARAIGDDACDALMSDAFGVVDGRVAPSNLLARIEAARV